jgi:DNA-binding NarL/FixJ family response regulator
MRAILVGSTRDRARLRSQLAGASIEIVGEFLTLAAARAAEIDADAIMLAGVREGHDDEPLAEPLTPREREVLALVAEGLSNKAIAEELGISDQTVKFHVASITGKLGAANRTEAVRLAVRQGLIVL